VRPKGYIVQRATASPPTEFSTIKALDSFVELTYVFEENSGCKF
jgi:hypothetical protein